MRRRHPEQGAAVVELAIAVPVVLFIALGVVTLTQVIYVHLNLASGVRAGARYAAHNDYDPSSTPPSSARRRTAAQIRDYTAEASQPAGLDPVACTADNCVTVSAMEDYDGTAVALTDTGPGDTVVVTAQRKVGNGLYRLAAGATNSIGSVIGLGQVLDPNGITVRAEAAARIE